MPLVPFRELMAAATAGDYAVGYFESWNLESLQGVARFPVRVKCALLAWKVLRQALVSYGGEAPFDRRVYQ